MSEHKLDVPKFTAILEKAVDHLPNSEVLKDTLEIAGHEAASGIFAFFNELTIEAPKFDQQREIITSNTLREVIKDCKQLQLCLCLM